MRKKSNLMFTITILFTALSPVLAEYNFTFDGGDGGIFDTGFTHTLPGTDGVNTDLLNLAAGELVATTPNGDPYLEGTEEEYNYLAVPWDFTSPFTVYCKINNPQVADNFDQGGVFIGFDADNWLKVSALFYYSNDSVSSIYEIGGNCDWRIEQFAAEGQVNGAQNIELWLEGDGIGNVSAYCSIDGSTRIHTADWHVPELLVNNGYAGLFTTNSGLSYDGVYGTIVDIHYDHFSVIPEPTTILLLGFGALALRRRK